MLRKDQLADVRDAQARSLRAALMIAGVTGTQLAEMIGVAQSTVYTWTSARSSPSMAQGRAIADALGMTLDEVFSSGASKPPTRSELEELSRAIERLAVLDPEERIAMLRSLANSGD